MLLWAATQPGSDGGHDPSFPVKQPRLRQRARSSAAGVRAGRALIFQRIALASSRTLTLPAGPGPGPGPGPGSGCADNPDAEGCKKSSFGGSCKSRFTCDGDAVLCATAIAVNDMYCALQVDPSDAAIYDAEKGKTRVNNNPSALVSISSGSFNTTDAIGGGGTCVNDLRIMVWGYSISLPISAICPYATAMGYLLVAVTFIICLGVITA